MTVSPNDILRVTANMSIIAGGVFQNVYHLIFEGSGPESDSTVADAVAEKLNDAYSFVNAFLTDALTFDDIDVWNVTQDRPMLVVDWPTLVAGLSTEQRLPQQCAELVLFRTATARSQGRKYVPMFTETSSQAGGILTTTAIAGLQNFGNELVLPENAGAGTVQCGNWRYPTGPFSRWTAATVSSLIRTQRRRVIGVGG